MGRKFVHPWHEQLPPQLKTNAAAAAALSPGAPSAVPTRPATTLHRMTMAKPISALYRLPLAASTARTLPPADMYWKPASMTKKAVAASDTAAPAVSSESKTLTIGP